jgi:predicted secreted protein
MSDIIVKETDGGRTFDVRSGDRIQICLEEIGGTAYGWKVTAANPSVVSYDEAADRYSPVLSGAIGGTSVRTMIFKAIGAGTTVIQLQLANRYAPLDVAKQLDINVLVSES